MSATTNLKTLIDTRHMFCSFSNVRIHSINACVPPNEICLEDEVQYYGGNLKKVRRLTKAIGMEKRRVAPAGITCADLCLQSANELIESNNIDRHAIDALIFLSQTPDYPMPATACRLQSQLGLSDSCAAMDISQGCSGYIYGLWTAASLVASGACKNVLLLCGHGHPNSNPANRIVTPVFGFGGSATYLIAETGTPEMFFELYTDGSGFETIIQPAGGAKRPFSLDEEEDRILYEDMPDGEGNPWRLSQPYMNGRAIYDFTQRVVPPHIIAFMKKCGVTADKISRLFLHQANSQIVEMIAEKTGFENQEQLSASFRKYGNLACASIPVQICEVLGNNMQKTGLALCCGYGIGLSWGSGLIDMAGLRTGTVSDYSGPVPENYEREFIDHWRKIFTGEKND